MNDYYMNEQTGRGVQITSSVPDYGAEIERTYAVALLYFKTEYKTWASFNRKQARDLQQAQEWFAKSVAWSNQ